jgi:hypothetical protein
MAKKALPPTGGPGHAGHRASRGSKQPIDEGTVPMVVAVIADGYVYGATETASSDTAEDPRYWLQLRLDREPYALFMATVPSDLADKLEVQGTSDQEFSDGYEAMRAVAPYMDSEPFYESPEEWANDREELEEATTATHAYVLLREIGKKRWLYLDGKGGEAATRVRAARYPIEKAHEIAQDIMDDNPGTWEAKVLPIE